MCSVLCFNRHLWLRRLKNTCKEVLFSTVPNFAVVQTSNFTKNDLFCRYFAKILTWNTEQLFRKNNAQWLFLKILKYAIIYYITRHCFPVFNWHWTKKNLWNSNSLIIKKRMTKKEVGLTTYFKRLKQ